MPDGRGPAIHRVEKGVNKGLAFHRDFRWNKLRSFVDREADSF
jgi:hypothetical protein